METNTYTDSICYIKLRIIGKNKLTVFKPDIIFFFTFYLV